MAINTITGKEMKIMFPNSNVQRYPHNNNNKTTIAQFPLHGNDHFVWSHQNTSILPKNLRK